MYQFSYSEDRYISVCSSELDWYCQDYVFGNAKMLGQDANVGHGASRGSETAPHGHSALLVSKLNIVGIVMRF